MNRFDVFLQATSREIEESARKIVEARFKAFQEEAELDSIERGVPPERSWAGQNTSNFLLCALFLTLGRLSLEAGLGPKTFQGLLLQAYLGYAHQRHESS